MIQRHKMYEYSSKSMNKYKGKSLKPYTSSLKVKKLCFSILT